MTRTPGPASRPSPATSTGETPAVGATGAPAPPLASDLGSSALLNFYVKSFDVPPFLLPLYQAAAIQYGVPWTVLAAINEIETDYGRNLSTSSAGAVGWMQFLPSIWKQYGVDADADGMADPYDPADAIFSAARYLSAAGAAHNLSGAIFAYDRASWYVQSVLLRARLLQGIPGEMLNALTGLMLTRFPVAGRLDGGSQIREIAGGRFHGPAATVSGPAGAPVIAMTDGRIVKLGEDRSHGRFLVLRDGSGNRFRYSHLGEIAASYPVLETARIATASKLHRVVVPRPGRGRLTVATAGSQRVTASVRSTAAASSPAGGGGRSSSQPVLAKERLFGDPRRPASFAAGGDHQVQTAPLSDHLSQTLRLSPGQYTLARLRPGAIVVAGTILGRLARAPNGRRSGLTLEIRPGGSGAPPIDPLPVLQSAELLHGWTSALDERSPRNLSIRQALLLDERTLAHRVLANRGIHIYRRGRHEIAAGLIDRRVLAALEYLALEGFDPTVSGLVCGCTRSAHAARQTVDITALDGIPVAGHGGAGQIDSLAVKSLLALRGELAPTQITPQVDPSGQPALLSLPAQRNEIEITYLPPAATASADPRSAGSWAAGLTASQWTELIHRLAHLNEPSVPSR